MAFSAPLEKASWVSYCCRQDHLWEDGAAHGSSSVCWWRWWRCQKATCSQNDSVINWNEAEATSSSGHWEIKAPIRTIKISNDIVAYRSNSSNINLAILGSELISQQQHFSIFNPITFWMNADILQMDQLLSFSLGVNGANNSGFLPNCSCRKRAVVLVKESTSRREGSWCRSHTIAWVRVWASFPPWMRY